MENRNSLAGADFIRALACLGVLAHHLLQRVSPAALPGWMSPIRDFGLMGSFGVAAFFVLSGYLLARPFWLALQGGAPMPDIRTYALRRGARIAPAFYLALTVTFILSFTLLDFRFGTGLLTRYVAGLAFVSDFHWFTLFPVEYNGPLWSIGFEVTCYALLPFALWGLFLLRRRGMHARYALVVFAGVIGLVLVVHSTIRQFVDLSGSGAGWDYGLTGGARVWMPNFNPAGFFAIFAIGALAAGVGVQLGERRHWLFDVAGVAGLAIAAYALMPYVPRTQTDGLGWLGIPYGFPLFPLGIGLALATLPLSQWSGPLLDNPASRYVAKVSFGVYLWHYLVIELVRDAYVPNLVFMGMSDFAEWSVWSLAVTGISFAIANLSYNLLEEPIMKWARRREVRQA